MAPLSDPSQMSLVEAIKEAEQRWGRKIHMIDTPQINVEPTKEGYAEAQAQVRRSAEIGEVYEDVEIAMAALEHRFPDLSRRSSPIANQAAFGQNNK